MRRIAWIVTVVGLLALASGSAVAWRNHSHKRSHALPTNCIVFSNGIGERVTLDGIHGEGTYVAHIADPRALPLCSTLHNKNLWSRLQRYPRTKCSYGTPVDLYMEETGELSYACSTDPERVAAYRKKYADIFSGKQNPNTVKPEQEPDPGFPYICFADKRNADRYKAGASNGELSRRNIPGHSGYCYRVNQ
jgi:hypothetical protein